MSVLDDQIKPKDFASFSNAQPVPPVGSGFVTNENNQTLVLNTQLQTESALPCSESLTAKHRYFVICEICYWTASLIDKPYDPSLVEVCPQCSSASQVSLIPLAKCEEYRFTIDPKRGLDVRFSSSSYMKT